MREWAECQGPRARGNTLLELLVVLAILGVLAGVTGVAFRETRDADLIDPTRSRVAEARRDAIRAGRAITVTVVRQGRLVTATAHPDGSVVADTSLAIDRLSGRAIR